MKDLMNPIQMVDLHSQYLRIKPEMDAAIQRVLDSSAFIQGTPVTDFEDSCLNTLVPSML